MRGGDSAAFPDHDRFVELQGQRQLSSPQGAATGVRAGLQRPDFGQQPMADAHD